jgi:hypothetical protein
LPSFALSPDLEPSTAKEFLMQQTDLNRAVATATGDTVRTICRLGFSLCLPDADPDSYTINRETAAACQEERRHEPVCL